MDNVVDNNSHDSIESENFEDEDTFVEDQYFFDEEETQKKEPFQIEWE